MTERAPEAAPRAALRDWLDGSFAWSRARRARVFTLLAAMQCAVFGLVGGAAVVFTEAPTNFRWTGWMMLILGGASCLIFLGLTLVGRALESRGSDASGFLIWISHIYGLLVGACLYLAGPFSGVTWLTIAASAVSMLIGVGAAAALRVLGSLAVTLLFSTWAGIAGWINFEPLLQPPVGTDASSLRFAGTLVVHLFAAAAALSQLGFMTIILRDRERKFRGLSSRDPLTGIANRRIMMERLEEAWSRAQRHHEPLAIAIADVDHFKVVNDRHGHPTGDRVLKQVALMLRTSLRGEDTVGRWGGEEFMILLPLQGLVSAKAALERCRVRIQGEPIESEDGRPVRVTTSFGLAVQPGCGAQSLAELIAAADSALYRAKRNGRNRVDVGAEAQREAAAAS